MPCPSGCVSSSIATPIPTSLSHRAGVPLISGCPACLPPVSAPLLPVPVWSPLEAPNLRANGHSPLK